MGNSCSSGQKKKDKEKTQSKVGSPLGSKRRSSAQSTESIPYGKGSPTTTRVNDWGTAPSEATNLPPRYDANQSQLEEVSEMSTQDLDTPQSPPVSKLPSTIQTTVEKDSSGLSDMLRFPEAVRSLLLGRFEEPLPPCSVKQISLYFSADYNDTQVERSAFMESIYPDLRLRCAENDYELNVVDLHLGLNGDCLDDHSFKEVCLDTIRELRGRGQLITVVFLNEVLDTPLLPREILATDFESFKSNIESEEKKQLFEKWYFLDENANPLSYILCPISEHLPCLLEELQDTRLEAINEWRKESKEMLETLYAVLGEEEKSKYLITILEEELKTAVFDDPSMNKHCLWLQRRFTHRSKTDDSTASNESQNKSFSAKLDEITALKLRSVKMHLEEHLSESQKLIFRVKWHDGTIDPVAVPQHSEYLNELCTTVKEELCKIIDGLHEELIMEESHQLYKGIENQLYTELVQQAATCKALLSSFVGRQELLAELQAYIISDSNHPIIIHGPAGCGKTALVAQASQLCSDWLPIAPVIVRFVGVTHESRTLEQVLRSICEQGCALFGEHPFIASKSGWEPNQVLEVIMDKVSSHRPLIIFIDGIDQVDSFSSKDLQWLPAELPKHVKLILSVRDETDEFQELKEHLLSEKEESFLLVPGLTQEEGLSLVEEVLQKKDRKITDSQRQLIQECFEKCNFPLYAELLAHQSSEWESDQSPDDIVIKHTSEGVFMDSVTEIEKCLSAATLGFILGLLVTAKHGLSDPEVLDILSCEESFLDHSFLVSNASAPSYFPYLLWYQTKKKLSLFLKTSIVGGKCLISWKNNMFKSLCKRYCSHVGVTTNSLTEALINYFQEKHKNYKNKSESSEEGAEKMSQKFVLEQPLLYKFHPNRRKVDELPFYCLQYLEDSWVREHFLFNVEWLQCKLQGSDPYQVLEDIAIYQSHAPTDEEVLLLQKVIQLSSYALRYDGLQFLSQVYGRLLPIMTTINDNSQFSSIRTIFHTACWPPTPSLLPLMPCLQPPHLEHQQSQDTGDKNTARSFCGLYWLKDDLTHILSLSTESEEIILWNIYEQTPVRIIKGVSQPRNIQMIDTYRALVLCNRELKVYDLNEGKFLKKLKGVMNQKMAYFGLHNENYVVALSRNRMYLNMMNLETGDLETTFKVGEDRFLNSLLVSASGRICVCGDETQKPFPLLVWDLASRKLMYDLRIPHHEFVTRLSAISSDGHYVAIVCRELNDSSPNFIIVYDLQSGTLFKKWKPESSSCSIAISSQGGCVVNGLENTWILVWDLATGGRRFILRGHSAPVDNIKIDESGTRCLTFDLSGRDRSIRLWDLAKGICLAVFTPDQAISCCEFSSDGRAVVMGLEGKDELVTLLLCHRSTIEEEKRNVVEFGDPENKGKIFYVGEEQ
ncbi:NACHT and WD repeat domain-containing protein 2-like isoform X1 [Tachypleus tridentatus]|uniref:NACHT and WD repeat domain-containing protein 2-like isoform X1 n=2 Tax=Tachypleus tridentatus TaxID=6853 RepID=UPI003FD0F581